VKTVFEVTLVYVECEVKPVIQSVSGLGDHLAAAVLCLVAAG